MQLIRSFYYTDVNYFLNDTHSFDLIPIPIQNMFKGGVINKPLEDTVGLLSAAV